MVNHLPDKSSAADPVPTSVLKGIADLVAMHIVELFNRSLDSGHVPSTFKHAILTTIVKKAGLDPSEVGSCRPISNLPVLPRAFECVVARPLSGFLDAHQQLPMLQSGFRSGHFTETAVLRVLSDMLAAVDHGDLAVLDLSAVFDTVDYQILLEHLRRSFGISGRSLDWFTSYVTSRAQGIRRGGSTSRSSAMRRGVPQSSVLSPILFLM
jgi:hypothetical protein